MIFGNRTIYSVPIIVLTEIQPFKTVFLHELKTEKPIEDLGGQYWRRLKRVAFG